MKEEKFCQAYIRLEGKMSDALREAYDCRNMKPETVNRKAFAIFNKDKIRARIKLLQDEIQKRNEMTIDKLVTALGDMVMFDIADLYNENGALKKVHEMPLAARRMILQLDSDDILMNQTLVGYTKRVKLVNKLDAIEKLMKHLGGYERDNKQKSPVVQINPSKTDEQRLAELMEKYSKNDPNNHAC